MKNILMGLVLIIVVLHSANRASCAQTNSKQKPPKCQLSGKIGGKYNLLFASKHPSPNGPSLTLLVVIKPKNINREYLLEFVKRLRQKYCNETNLIAIIYDNKKEAEYKAMLDYAIYKTQQGSYRGDYGFFKDKNLESIRFSTKRGNPIDEVRIDLKDGKPVDKPSETDK